MKRVLIKLGILIIIISTILSCGGDSSEEAKELLKRILILVGIPQSMVINICQDNNENGICEDIEPQVSVLIEKGDTIATIWQKIIKTEDGKYLLETYDPTKPILLQLKDTKKIKYDNGEVNLTYNGFKKEQREKELSILEAMVDAGYLKSKDIVKVKEMNAIDKFYTILLDDLTINYNTLRDRAFVPSRAVDIDIKEMARELLDNNVTEEFPERVNECKDDNDCVNEHLENMSEELLITDNEADRIVETENNPYLDENKDPYSSNGNNSPYSSNENQDPYSSTNNNDPYSNGKNSDPYSSNSNEEAQQPRDDAYREDTNQDPYNTETQQDPYQEETQESPKLAQNKQCSSCNYK